MSLAELGRKAWRFGAALARHAGDGFLRASQGTIDQRIEICLSCPDDKFDQHRKVCTECTCNCSGQSRFLNKLAWASEACPLGHWPAGELAPPPKLTVGMACWRDFDGVYFTVRSLALHHPEIVDQMEILVVDNCPEFPDRPPGFAGPHTPSERIRALMATIPGGRYIPYSEKQGTAAPRDQVFQQARGEIVICIDSHVLLAPDSLWHTIRWLDDHPEFHGLFQGPMLMDSGDPVTHMEPVWRDRMFGTWATFPDDAWQAAPRPIPMHGLGLFGCRRADWLGFNPGFTEFGGEEGYIHKKYELAGRQTLLFPWLEWAHRFADGDAGYPSGIRSRIRNYIIGWSELGLDIDEIQEHFFGGPVPMFHPHEWNEIVIEAAGVMKEDAGTRGHGDAVTEQEGATL